MIYICLFLALLFALIGIAGAVVPVLPGVPMNYAALLLVWWCCPGQISGVMLVIWLLLTVVALIIDYVAPLIMTRLGGGSKASMRWATAGMIVGLFFMPLGLVLGPMIGAYLGEMSESANSGKSLRVALLSFLAFLLTTGIKLCFSLLMTYQMIMAAIGHFSQIIN